jgi:hypothetical protein
LLGLDTETQLCTKAVKGKVVFYPSALPYYIAILLLGLFFYDPLISWNPSRIAAKGCSIIAYKKAA